MNKNAEHSRLLIQLSRGIIVCSVFHVLIKQVFNNIAPSLCCRCIELHLRQLSILADYCQLPN